MTDVVERLLAGTGGGKHWMDLHEEAAAEIVRLRALTSLGEPLTGEQLATLVLQTVYEGDASTPHREAWAAEIGVPFARAIERAHGIGA
jgi:hypothetical protein